MKKIRLSLKTKNFKDKYSIYVTRTQFCKKYVVYELYNDGYIHVLIGTDNKYEILMWMDIAGFSIGRKIMSKSGCYRVFDVIKK